LGFAAVQAVDLVEWDPAQSSPEFKKLIADISIILGPPPKHVKETAGTTGAGFGIRWFSPFGPIVIDMGFNLNPQKGEKSRVMEFTAGTTF